MDILHFINSRDIREYLKKIGYEFNSLEAAWIIYQCKSASVEEKHAAWRELIQTMPDCHIEKRPNTDPHDSLHRFLEEYIALEERMLEEFKREDKDAVFVWTERQDRFWFDYPAMFSTYEKCRENIEEYISEDIDGAVTAYRITKIYRDWKCHNSHADLSAYGKILSISSSGLSESEEALRDYSFEGLWFAFPTPFKKGDILGEPDDTDSFCCGPFLKKGPFVVTDITSKDDQRAHGRGGDNSDMTARGYFLKENGIIYNEAIWNYMNLEYYHGKLAGKERILKALSSYIKEEIDVELLLNACHEIMADEYAKDKTEYVHRNYTYEGLLKAGLENERMRRLAEFVKRQNEIKENGK